MLESTKFAPIIESLNIVLVLSCVSEKNKAFSELTEKLRKHDGHYLEQFVESLLTGNDKMANLCSRYT